MGSLSECAEGHVAMRPHKGALSFTSYKNMSRGGVASSFHVAIRVVTGMPMLHALLQVGCDDPETPAIDLLIQ